MNISGAIGQACKAGYMAIGALILSVVAACTSGGDKLVLHTATGAYSFAVEIADDAKERADGLMFRTELAPDAGMLFDYHEEQQTAFWMQNTLIPLDMIFIGADGIVKNIHVNAKPLDTTSIPSRFPVRFVLEIPGGRSKEIGLAVGDRVEHTLIGSGS